MHRASKAGKKRSFNRYWLRLNISPLLANMTHRALPDAYVTADRQRRRPDHVVPTTDPAPPLCASANTRGAWSELPIDYLDWIVEKSDLNEDVKFTANHYRTDIAPQAPPRWHHASGASALCSITAPASRP